MKFRTQNQFNKGLVSDDTVAKGKEAEGLYRWANNIVNRSGLITGRYGSSLWCDFHLCPGVMGEDLGRIFEYRREQWSDESSEIWNALVFTTINNRKLWYVRPDDSTTVAVAIETLDGLEYPMTSLNLNCVNVYDHLIIANGYDDIYAWDGLDLYLAGIAPPETIVTDTNSAGDITGYRKYKVTYYRSGAPYDKESNATDEEVVGPLTSKRVLLAANPTSDSQVTHYRLYATQVYTDTTDPEIDFFLMEERTVLEGPVFIDNYGTDNHGMTDENLVLQTPYDTTDRTVPPIFQFMLWHDNRLYGVTRDDPSVVWYTEFGKPWYVPLTNWDEVNRDDGDVIVALGSIGPTRYIFKTRAIYEWTGDPENITPIRPVERPDATMNMNRVGVGCRDPLSLAGWGNSLIFRGNDGHVYMLTQDQVIQLTRYFTDIVLKAGYSRAVVYEDYYIIGVMTDGHEVYICDLNTGGWTCKEDWEVPENFLVTKDERYLVGTIRDGIKHYHNSNADTDWNEELYYNDEDPPLDDDGEVIDEEDYRTVEIEQGIQTAYLEMITEFEPDKIGVVRRVIVESHTRPDITVTVYNERGESVTGTLLSTSNHFTLPDRDSDGNLTHLRGRYASVKLEWTGTAEITAVSIGFIRKNRS